jgi:cytochrome P450
MGGTIWYGRAGGSTFELSEPSTGDIVYFKAAGRNIFVLNSPDVVHELLEKRSNIYSDRPVLPLGGEIMGFARGTALAQHEARHKASRKLFAQTMGKSQAKSFWGLQEWQTTRFLQRLEETPDQLINHIRW